MPTTSLESLVSRNPASGAELGRVQITPVDDVAGIVERAHEAQAGWSATSWRQRQAVLKHWWRTLARDAEAWADLIRDEIGKPRGEAMAGDDVPLSMAFAGRFDTDKKRSPSRRSDLDISDSCRFPRPS